MVLKYQQYQRIKGEICVSVPLVNFLKKYQIRYNQKFFPTAVNGR